MKTVTDTLPADVSMYVGPRAPRVPVIDVREGEHPPHVFFHMPLQVGRKIARIELNESDGSIRLLDPDRGIYVGFGFTSRMRRRIRRASATPLGRNGRDAIGEAPMPGSSPGPRTKLKAGSRK